jgi:acyl-coenzyme A synthetase/AMP-(fatty) acid ligase
MSCLEQFGALRAEAGNNRVGDDAGTVRYAEVSEAVEDLGRYLDACGGAAIRCVFVAPRNDVAQVAIILALMTKKINFFLSSSNAVADPAVPAFCDRVLVRTNGNGSLREATQAIALQNNPAYSGPEESLAIAPGAGVVVFSSSGTSGTPKFVCYQSGNLVNNARKCLERFGVTRTSSVLVPAPVSHMYGFGVGLLPALVAGANLCLIEKNNLIKLYDKLNRFKPDVTLLTPTVCKMLLVLNKPITGPGLFITAGDRLNKDVYAAFEGTYGKLLNLYGSTEMGAIATAPPEGSAQERINGHLTPLPGVEISLDPPGKGEIVCRHSAGYAFYVDGRGRKTGTGYTPERGYATKDLGETTAGGGIRVIGRIDHCTNRSGFLVSLPEIEAALEEAFTEMNQAVVWENHQETIRGKGLVAVLELKNTTQPDVEAVRATCLHKMPKHWVPDHFYFVTQLPRLGNGKPDRNQLIRQYAHSN